MNNRKKCAHDTNFECLNNFFFFLFICLLVVKPFFFCARILFGRFLSYFVSLSWRWLRFLFIFVVVVVISRFAHTDVFWFFFVVAALYHIFCFAFSIPCLWMYHKLYVCLCVHSVWFVSAEIKRKENASKWISNIHSYHSIVRMCECASGSVHTVHIWTCHLTCMCVVLSWYIGTMVLVSVFKHFSM